MNRRKKDTGAQDFAAVYDLYYDRIYKYIYTLLLNREDAEDITSETFLTAFRYYDRYDPERASVGTWLTRIAHNCAVNLVRSAAYAKRAELPEGQEEWEPASFTEQVEASDTVGWLYARLLPEERELLNLRCVMELKDREIAALLGLQEKTVNKRYQRLLSKCRMILSGGEIESL